MQLDDSYKVIQSIRPIVKPEILLHTSATTKSVSRHKLTNKKTVSNIGLKLLVITHNTLLTKPYTCHIEMQFSPVCPQSKIFITWRGGWDTLEIEKLKRKRKKAAKIEWDDTPEIYLRSNQRPQFNTRIHSPLGNVTGWQHWHKNVFFSIIWSNST